MSRTEQPVRLARAVTDVLAPAYLVMGVLPLIGWHSTGNWEGVGWGLLAALFCGGLPFAVILLGVRLGHWTDKHLRERTQRAVPLSVAMGSVLVGVTLLAVFDAPREVFALVVAMLAGLMATTAVTVMWKISVHTAVAAGTVVILIIVFGAEMTILALGVAAVGWSRVALRDHTTAQTIAGAALGAVVTAVTFGQLN
ncbi:hypothetical protein ACWD04_29710 [Streptomyces sp. NPDC002911]